MNQQQLNLPASAIAQAEALASLVTYLEKEFNISFDEARWMSAGIIHNLPFVIESTPESKKGFVEVSQEIKSQRNLLNN